MAVNLRFFYLHLIETLQSSPKSNTPLNRQETKSKLHTTVDVLRFIKTNCGNFLIG